MRRCKDDWVNATQILKLCNFPKAKRTKILEKGVQQGRHEKIQGGYGRFQGTWIPLPDARKLAAEYGITAEMVPVLYIDIADPSFIIPKKSKPPVASSLQKDGTPVKRKYVKKSKKEITPKKLKLDDNYPPQAVFTLEYPANLSRGSSHMSQMNQTPMQHIHHGSISGQQHLPMHNLPPTFQQLEFVPSGMNGNILLLNGFSQSYSNYPPQVPFQQSQLPQIREQPTKFGSFQGGMEGITQQQIIYQQHQKGALSQSTNETNWSQEEHTRDSDTSISSVDAKHGKLTIDEDASHAAQLLRFFSEDNADIPYFLFNPPPDFNINEPIDDEGHTTLHWAASIGNLSLIHLIVSKGANSLAVNNYGLNPLSKCVSFNNCHDLRNFPQILDALEMCLINTDINGRTPLHYLCQFSKVKSKLGALTYYLEILFNKLNVMSTKNGASGVNLMKNVLDHQDVNGDTCLHLAARAGCTLFIKFLLNNGARDDLLNVNNEPAKTIIMQLDLLYNQEQPARQVAKQLTQYFQPTLEVEQEQGSRKRQSHVGLGTPIQSFTSRRAETPDTQRTTIQDDDDEEFNDRVSKEHLRILMEEQAGTVDENKENIFVEDSKVTYDAMSTPKFQIASPQSGSRQNVLGVISERVAENTPLPKTVPASPARPYVPNPPKLDNLGHIVAEGNPESEESNEPRIKLPMKDASDMMHGMINLLSDSYTQVINGLNKEQKRVESILIEKKDLGNKCIEKVKVLLDKNGFKEIKTFDEAKQVVDQEVDNFEQELRAKENQLLCLFEKAQAFELANLVQANESSISSPSEEHDDASERWSMAVDLTKAQLQRNELVAQVTRSVKACAINNKMNKYRKLISLSCGLRVEDIDGLIDGIEESLMEGTM